MGVLHDDAVMKFCVWVYDGVVTDGGAWEDADVGANFAVFSDDDWANDVGASIDMGVISDGDWSFDSNVFFDGARGLRWRCMHYCFVDTDEIPGIDDIHPGFGGDRLDSGVLY